MLTSTVETLLNRGLPRSPRARELCAELAGRRIAVEVRGVADLLVESDGNGIKLSRGSPEGAEARVRGGPIALLALASSDPAATLRRDDIELEGDAELAEKFHELARLLRPDLEEELALAIGDVPAHRLARLAKAAAGWWRGAAETTVRNLAEYFAHERRDLVSRAEGRQLLDGIDDARDRIERIEARIDILARRIEAERPGTRRP